MSEDGSYILSPVHSFLVEYNRSDKRKLPYKDDLYQFGHLLLFCSTLKKPLTIYSDIESNQNKFSDEWIDHLSSILLKSEEERPDALELYQQYLKLKSKPQKRNVRTHLKGLQISNQKEKRELSPF